MKIKDLKNYEIKEHRFLHDINTDAYVLSHKKQVLYSSFFLILVSELLPKIRQVLLI